MGSLFTFSDQCQMTKKDGSNRRVPFYMQWVPGYVVYSVTSPSSLYHVGSESINSIMALPHVSNTETKESEITNKNRYYPLLRGFNETPVKGDSVLLCSIGGRNYYLGPLNNGGDACFNEDPDIAARHLSQGVPTENKLNEDGTIPSLGIVDYRRLSLNFHHTPTKKLIKDQNLQLDFPPSEDEFEETHGNKIPKGSKDGTMIGVERGDTHGDMIMEGRHGNSVRIGSRMYFPYLIFSNHRNRKHSKETLNDGSIISITSYGTLQQHYGGYSYWDRMVGAWKKTKEFILASDIPYVWSDKGIGEADPMKVDNQSIKFYNSLRSIRSSVEFVNSEEWYGDGSTVRENKQSPPHNSKDTEKNIYGYTGDQMLFNSNRIIINSRKNDIYISSALDVHIGTGRHLTLNSEDSMIFEAANIYLGQNAKKSTITEDVQQEPMVLGQTLVNMLSELIDTLSELHTLSPTGQPVPITDAKLFKITDDVPGEGGRLGLTTIKNKLDSLLSFYHYIEPNDTSNKTTVEDIEDNISGVILPKK